MKIKKILSSLVAGVLAISSLASVSSFGTSANELPPIPALHAVVKYQVKAGESGGINVRFVAEVPDEEIALAPYAYWNAWTTTVDDPYTNTRFGEQDMQVYKAYKSIIAGGQVVNSATDKSFVISPLLGEFPMDIAVKCRFSMINLGTSMVSYAILDNRAVSGDSSSTPDSSEPESSEPESSEPESSEPEAATGTTITINSPQVADWTSVFPAASFGDDFIDARSFTRDLPLDVTINYDLGGYFEDDGYANIKICEAASGWKALRRIDSSYVEGFKLLGTECDYDESGIGYAYQDGNGNTVVVPYAMQTAGDVTTNDPDNHVMKFRLTADCVNYLIDSATASDSSYNGVQLQGYNVIVKSITVSQPGVTMCSNGENAGITVTGSAPSEPESPEPENPEEPDDSSDVEATDGTTFTISSPQAADWTSVFPAASFGDDFIDARSFTRDMPLEITINYDLGGYFEDDGYANIKICEAASGWKALRRIDSSYVEGFKLLGTECDYDESGIGYAYQDGNGNTVVVPYAMQTAGDVTTNDPDNHVMKFTLTADCVNYLIDSATASDSSYNGVQLQGYNVIVKSITVSQPGVTMCSNGENAGIVVS